MTFYAFLYKIRVIKLTKKKVEKWNRNQDTDKLLYALKNGLYDVRIMAAKYLGNLKEKQAIPALRKSLNDKVKPVFIESSIALRKITKSPEIEKEIKEKLEEWKEKENKPKKGRIRANVKMPKWEKTDWLAIVKKQLLKPMRW